MKKIKRTLALLLASVLALGVLSGCNSEPKTDGDSSNSDAEELYEFTAITAAGSNTYDLSQATGMSFYINAYEGLYKFDANGDIVLGLAEKADVSADGLTYTYTIRSDAKYSDGKPVKAQDFEYSWKRLANPKTGAVYGSLVASLGIKNAANVLYKNADVNTLGVKATDDHTLVVEFDFVLPYMEKILVFPQFDPINQEVCESFGDQFGLTAETAAPSAGPLYLSQWDPDNGYTYVKNDNYYDSKNIHTGKLEYQIVTDTTTALMLWKSGKADYVALNKDTEDLYKDDPAFGSESYATLLYLSPNLKVKELQNENLRKALAISFDKDTLAKTIVGKDAQAANFAVPEDFAYDDKGVPFRKTANQYFLQPDKAKAKDYWEKAKKELGVDSLKLELSYSELPPFNLVAQYIQSEIQNTLPGVTIELKAVPFSSRYSVLGGGEYQLYLNSWTADYDDPITYLEQWQTGNFYNFGGWSNKTYDQLIGDSNSKHAKDADARLKDLADAEKVLLDEAAIIPVTQGSASVLLNPDYKVPNTVKGYLWQYAQKVK